MAIGVEGLRREIMFALQDAEEAGAPDRVRLLLRGALRAIQGGTDDETMGWAEAGLRSWRRWRDGVESHLSSAITASFHALPDSEPEQ